MLHEALLRRSGCTGENGVVVHRGAGPGRAWRTIDRGGSRSALCHDGPGDQRAGRDA
ncbi:MAG: hypothetical protein MZV49_25565 [Rhodopseudomonas palustris]|nr:hypothetical protein [Rhodopseudomonas palustris]